MIRINGEQQPVPEQWKEGRLVDFIRDHLHLTGTKYGCGQGLCGACTVHLDGIAVRSCQLSVEEVDGSEITTIEGLSTVEEPDDLHPVQRAWIAENVPQCGYCQPGQIMSAAALLSENNSPTHQEIVEAMSGNLCRCGTYGRIEKAILRAAGGSKP